MIDLQSRIGASNGGSQQQYRWGLIVVIQEVLDRRLVLWLSTIMAKGCDSGAGHGAKSSVSVKHSAVYAYDADASHAKQ